MGGNPRSRITQFRELATAALNCDFGVSLFYGQLPGKRLLASVPGTATKTQVLCRTLFAVEAIESGSCD
jgi:hypothetical protein